MSSGQADHASRANCSPMKGKDFSHLVPPTTGIPEKARAAVLHAHGEKSVIEDIKVVQEDELGSGECLVRILYTGLCHSDLSNAENIYGQPCPLPAILGHEGAGLIAALGKGYDGYLKVGDRVGVKYIQNACLACENCLRGHESNCHRGPKMSFTNTEGTFQNYVRTWSKYVTRIPDDLDLAEAAPVLCAGVTCLRGLKEAPLHIGDWVAVPGAGGGLGHLTCQYALALGYRVIGIDTGDEKRKMIEGYGAKFVDFKGSTSIVEDIKAITSGLGAHAAIVSADTEAAYTQALEYIRNCGALIVMGLPANAELRLPILQFALRSLRVIGTFVGNRADADEALALHAMGKAKLNFQVVKLDQINEMYDRMKQRQVTGRVVLDLTD